MTTALLLALSLLQAEPVATPPAPADPTSDAKPADVKAADAQAAETQPADAKPADAQAADAKPADAKPADAKPADAKPADAKPAEAKPAEAKPAEAADTKPADGSAPAAPQSTGAAVEAPKAMAAEPAPSGQQPAAAPAPAAGPPAVVVPAAGAGDAAAACPAAPAAPRERDLALIGYRIGLGFPEFGTASVIVRPLNWLRAGGGLTWNYAGYGLRGEVTLAPIRWYVSPTLNLAFGRYLKMDATKAAKIPTEVRGLASKVGYQYVDATLGLELGNQRHGMLVLQFGVTYISIDAPGTATFDGKASGGSSSTTTTVSATGVTVKGFAPAVSLSWLIFL